MKKSDFKALIKECLVEILQDEMEIFAESKNKRGMKASPAETRKVMKRTLSSLMNGGHQQQRSPMAIPQQFSQHNMRPVPNGLSQPVKRPQNKPMTMEEMTREMILSAGSTMRVQNESGHRSTAGMMVDTANHMVGGSQNAQYQEDFDGYDTYGNAPIPHDMGGAGGMSMPMGSGGGIDGDSHWAQIAFFDEK